MSKLKDLTGLRFGRLVVIERAVNRFSTGGQVKAFWLCRCDCGSEREVVSQSLTQGDTTSCGCFAREHSGEWRKTHGRSRTKEYAAWLRAKHRCYSPDYHSYHRYGGRGIKVCDRWRDSFENFFSDMGPRPPGCSLDREENNGDYEPGNCRWATALQQSRNTCKSISVSGMPIGEIADKTGLKRSSIYSRFRRGWSVEEIFSGRKKAGRKCKV